MIIRFYTLLLGTQLLLRDNKSIQCDFPNYWPELDGLRAIAFLLVFISHTGAIPLIDSSWLYPLVAFYNLVVKWGWIGVDLFLVLSGFLITSLLLKERAKYASISFRYFFIRRMLRIWPLYYLIFLLGFLVFPVIHWRGISYTSNAYKEMVSTYFMAFLLFVGNLQFAHTIKSISPMIISLWTACLEEQFYIVWGGLLSCIKKKSNLIKVSLLLLTLGVILRFFIQQQSTSHNTYYYNTLTHMDPLILGSLAALGWTKYYPYIKKLHNIFLLIGILLLAFVIGIFPDIFQNKSSIVLAMMLIGLGWTCFLLGLLTTPKLQSLFSSKPLCALGKITYGLYLLHYPILVTNISLVNNHFLFLTELGRWCFVFYLTLLTSIIAAYLSWNYYEKPFNELRHIYSRQNQESLTRIEALAEH